MPQFYAIRHPEPPCGVRIQGFRFAHSKKNLNMAQLKEEVKNMLPFIYECQLKNSRSCMKFDCEKILGDHKLKTVGGEESIVEINSHLKMGQFFSWFFMVNQDFLPTEGCVIFNQSVEKAVFCLFKDLIKECSDLFFVKIKVVDFKSGHSSNNIVQDNIFLTLIQEGKESEINSENDKILSLIKFFKPSLTIEGDFLPFLSKNNFFVIRSLLVFSKLIKLLNAFHHSAGCLYQLRCHLPRASARR